MWTGWPNFHEPSNTWWRMWSWSTDPRHWGSPHSILLKLKFGYRPNPPLLRPGVDASGEAEDCDHSIFWVNSPVPLLGKRKHHPLLPNQRHRPCPPSDVMQLAPEALQPQLRAVALAIEVENMVYSDSTSPNWDLKEAAPCKQQMDKWRPKTLFICRNVSTAQSKEKNPWVCPVVYSRKQLSNISLCCNVTQTCVNIL